jgi:hypothetical protein
MDITKKLFTRALVVVTAIKIVFAFTFAIKNDEAYYLLWAKHLAGGYYDHPPMIGWLLHLMSYVSDSIVWLRMLAIGTGLVAVWVIYRFAVAFADEQKARFAALLFVLSPLYILLFLIGNDTPLLLFSSLAALLFLVSIEKEKPIYAMGSGMLLGAAILSKYLVAPLIIALAVFVLARSPRKRWRYLALAAAGAVPFVLQHLYYNYTHCWNTLNFHFFLRNPADPGLASLGFYVVGLALMMTPWGLWYLFRQRRGLTNERHRFLVTIVLAYTAFFALASLKSVIGLHFFLVYAPFVFALYAVVESPEHRKRMVRFSAAYAALLIVLFAALPVIPLDKLKGQKYHSDFVLGLNPRAICAQLEPYAQYPLFSEYYATASILSYECKRDVNVLFGTSRYGREFDRWTDLDAIDGKTIAVVIVGDRVVVRNPQRYFDKSRTETVLVDGAPFTILVGEGFKSERYKQEVMSKINNKYYRPPSWLPRHGCPHITVSTVGPGE